MMTDTDRRSHAPCTEWWTSVRLFQVQPQHREVMKISQNRPSHTFTVPCQNETKIPKGKTKHYKATQKIHFFSYYRGMMLLKWTGLCPSQGLLYRGFFPPQNTRMEGVYRRGCDGIPLISPSHKSSRNFPQRTGDSSLVRALVSWSKGLGFESLQGWWENFLLLGQLSVLTLISVSVPPLCYCSSM